MVESIPSAPEVEQSVLGGCFFGKDFLDEVKGRITPDCFYIERNRAVYEAILDCESSDLLSVEQKLKDRKQFDKIGGTAYLSDLSAQASTNPEYHTQILIEKYLLRQIALTCQKLRGKAMSSDDAYAVLDELNREVSAIDSGMKTKNSLTPSQIFEREANTPISEKLFLGVPKLDDGIYQNTMRRGQVEVTIADSGHGKTHYALYKASQLMRREYKVGWFQLEDMDVSTARHFEKTVPAHMDNVHICHNLYDIEDIKREARMLKREFGLDYIVFDYVQNIECSKKSRNEQVEYISRQITRMAKDLEAMCHVLSQVTISYGTRAGWKQEPGYGDVRWSQQLKQDAHIITSVFRPSRIESLTENDGNNVVDWSGSTQPYNSVWIKQAKVRYGKQEWKRLHMIHTDKGLQPYTPQADNYQPLKASAPHSVGEYAPF